MEAIPVCMQLISWIVLYEVLCFICVVLFIFARFVLVRVIVVVIGPHFHRNITR